MFWHLWIMTRRSTGLRGARPVLSNGQQMRARRPKATRPVSPLMRVMLARSERDLM